MKFAFLHFNKELVLQEPSKDLSDVVDVCFFTFRVDHDIVNIYSDIFAQHVMKNVTDGTFECCWC